MEKEIKDPEMWKAAKKRALFKYSLLIYFIINLFYWTIGAITFANNSSTAAHQNLIPWPVWPTIIWGLGIGIYYLMVYNNHRTNTEKEYQKLKNEQQ